MADSKPFINLPASANIDATVDSSPPGAPSSYDVDTGSRTPVVIKTHLPSSPLDSAGMIGQYQLIEKLGEGGMGTVYKAEDTVLKRRVALKVMKPNIASEPISRERFFREARAAAQLEHDNIVAIYQVAEENGSPYLAMPLLKGEALGTILKRDTQPRLDFVLKVARDVASGLAAAHAQGLVHRDIKPDNIWIEPASADGGEIRAKILDFGLARPRQEDGALLTRQGAFLGTPAYVAPEQARGMEVDNRADLFSLGCVLYEMCAGRRPFNGVDSMAVLTALISEQPHEPSRLNPATPPALSGLIMKLLEKDPHRRPETATVVVERVKAIQQELAGGTAPSAIGRSAVSVHEYDYRPEEPRSMLPIVLLGLLILVGAIGYALYKYVPPVGPGKVEVLVDPEAEAKYSNSASALEITNAQTNAFVKRLIPKERKIDQLTAGTYKATIVDGNASLFQLKSEKSFDPKAGGRSIEFKVEPGSVVKLQVSLAQRSEVKPEKDKEKEKP